MISIASKRFELLRTIKFCFKLVTNIFTPPLASRRETCNKIECIDNFVINAFDADKRSRMN
ncbi:Ta75 [Troides aeacus nucleopolyhedrovirus]|nr:Ta75 [Troides aeacus nucleopolyhedrovirus]